MLIDPYEIPPVNQSNTATMDEIEILIDSLGLERKKVPQDGECLFRAIAEFIMTSQKQHKIVRKEICEFMNAHKKFFKLYISDNFDHYIANMKKSMVWGGQLEIEAASQRYKCCITVYSLKGIETEHHPEFNTKINLLFINGNHYDILYPRGHFEKLKICQNIIYDILEGVSQNREYKNNELDLWESGEPLNPQKEYKEEKIEFVIKTVDGGWGQSSELEKIKDKKKHIDTVQEVVTVEFSVQDPEIKKVVPVKKVDDRKVINKNSPLKLEKMPPPPTEWTDYDALLAYYKRVSECVILANFKRTFSYVLKKKDKSGWIIVDFLGKIRHKRGDILTLGEIYNIFGDFLFSRLGHLKITERELEDAIAEYYKE